MNIAGYFAPVIAPDASISLYFSQCIQSAVTIVVLNFIRIIAASSWHLLLVRERIPRERCPAAD
jgi:hypothetical protein